MLKRCTVKKKKVGITTLDRVTGWMGVEWIQ